MEHAYVYAHTKGGKDAPVAPASTVGVSTIAKKTFVERLAFSHGKGSGTGKTAALSRTSNISASNFHTQPPVPIICSALLSVESVAAEEREEAMITRGREEGGRRRGGNDLRPLGVGDTKILRPSGTLSHSLKMQQEMAKLQYLNNQLQRSRSPLQGNRTKPRVPRVSLLEATAVRGMGKEFLEETKFLERPGTADSSFRRSRSATSRLAHRSGRPSTSDGAGREVGKERGPSGRGGREKEGLGVFRIANPATVLK